MLNMLNMLNMLVLLSNSHSENGPIGQIMTNDCMDTDDILTKVIRFIGQINKVLYNFSKSNCLTRMNNEDQTRQSLLHKFLCLKII